MTVRSVAWESQVTAHILPLHSDTNSFPRLSGEVSHRFKVEMTRFQAFKCVALSSPEGPKEGSSKFIHVWPRKKKRKLGEEEASGRWRVVSPPRGKLLGRFADGYSQLLSLLLHEEKRDWWQKLERRSVLHGT